MKYKDPNLIDIYRDTQRYSFPIEPAILYTLEDLPEYPPHENLIPTPIEVVDTDTWTLTQQFCDEGLNPLVLNMASDFRPGGGVESGSKAQEEDLFRRSNYHQALPRSFYPLAKNQVVYSLKVQIIKDPEFRKIRGNYSVSCLACPALRNPSLYDGKYRPADEVLMTQKIEAIFKIAIHHGHDSLVLGALGCGAFGNPPEQVAEIFRFMINKYRGYFKKIGFGVLVVKSTDRDNLQAFQKLQ